MEQKEVLNMLENMADVEATLRWWLDVRMKDYADGQYGKKELRELLERIEK